MNVCIIGCIRPFNPFRTSKSPTMSGLWGWFGGSAAAKNDTPKDAILGLRSHLDMLHKRADFLTFQVDKETDKAREHVTTNKAGRFAAAGYI